MEARAAQVLTRAEEVLYRSSEELRSQRAAIHLDDRAGVVLVNFLEESASEPTREIKLIDIASAKPKDYHQDGNFQVVLHLTEKSGGATSFEFTKQESRDQWTALQSMLGKSEHVLVVDEDHGTISGIKTLEKPGTLAAFQLDVDGRRVNFEIPDDVTSTDEWKRIVGRVVEENKIQRSEGTSLYRYVKPCAQRVLLDRETNRLVNDIDNLHLDRLLEVAPEGAPPEEKVQESQECLIELDHQLARSPIWQAGAGPQLVAMILRRNIEKMKLINEVTLQAHAKMGRTSSSRPVSPVSSRSPSARFSYRS